MIIGITGYSGVLGKQLLKKLSKYRSLKIIMFKGNILEKKKVRNWVLKNKFDIIIHLAAVVAIKKFNLSNIYSSNVNFLGTKNIIDSLNLTKKKTFIFFSSTSHVYKKSYKKINEKSKLKPINLYGLSKLKAENYIISNSKINNYDYCIGRIFSFTSKNQSDDFFIPAIFKKFRKCKNPIKFDFENEFRDFIYIGDIIKIILKLIFLRKKGIFNICSGVKISTQEIVKKISFYTKKKFFLRKNSKQKVIGLFGSNLKIKKFYKIKLKNIDYIILNYLGNTK